MRNELTPNNTNRNIPISMPAHGEIKNMLNRFWNMVDFSHHGKNSIQQPKIEVTENKDDILVSAEMPGVSEKDIDLQISSDGYLTITGEKRSSSERKEKGNYLSEIRYGMIKRTIPLPWELDYENAEAQYDDGILKIEIPKSATEKNKLKKIDLKPRMAGKEKNN